MAEIEKKLCTEAHRECLLHFTRGEFAQTGELTREAAEQALKDAGLEVGNVTEENSSSITPGYVMNQTISPGTEVAEGTSVGFTVSIGPKTSGDSPSDGSDTENTN